MAATVKGIADPLVEVRTWSNVLWEILEGRGYVDPDVNSYDLITTYGKLSRARVELLVQVQDADLVLRAGEEIEARIPAIFDEVLQEALEPAAWMEDAEAFERSYDKDLERWTPEHRQIAAINLIEELDDAEVLTRVVAYCSGDSVQGPDLVSCGVWLLEHAHLFLPASVWVQGVAMGLRPSLGKSFQYGQTAEKFVTLLDAFSVAEQELKFEGQEPLTPDQLRALAERIRRR